MKNNGYTFVEVMVSATLLAIIVLGTAQYFALSRWEIEKGIRSQLAWAQMSSRMEKAVDLSFESLPDSLSEISFPITANGIQGYRTTSITSVDDSSDGLAPADTVTPDYMDVSIKFAWFNTDNITDSLTCRFTAEKDWNY